MNFQNLLLAAIESSEIPGAAEAVAKPVLELLQKWISAHMPPDSGSEFDSGWAALAAQLLTEIEQSAELPE
jgi:hypothetical protein